MAAIKMILLIHLAFMGLLVRRAKAGFDTAVSSNIVIYWGQNSYTQQDSQHRLADYCSDESIDIIPLAFLTSITSPSINFASAGDSCILIPGSQMIECPQIEEDIQTCQRLGKTIMLSIGGATYSDKGFVSSSDAVSWVDTLWAAFGPEQPGSKILRPFGAAVVDGFDLDLESAQSHMVPFADQLRANMDAAAAANGKTYYLSATPQFPYPDIANHPMLNGRISFDFIMVQFYNNYCGVSSYVEGEVLQKNFNFETWDTWARTESKNRNVKVLLGIPGNEGAGAGYVAGTALLRALSFSEQYKSFGGVMIWDMSQVYANPGFYLR
ncbi:glycoside hydrolase family 18 protein [Stachybotrys elegans]|uniref:chitinase n=1 Tax=Stachybotrys elegans TaxID=80388 RepID=A0A8K0S7F5_9HYPO|nr:glycoside hydrolase family 18 protein [Stachybotrys elegans]